MSLTQALNTALSGLNVAQTSVSVVAGNIANAQTPGYVRKVAVLTENSVGTDRRFGVQVTAINRVLDQFVQTQLRTEFRRRRLYRRARQALQPASGACTARPTRPARWNRRSTPSPVRCRR